MKNRALFVLSGVVVAQLLLTALVFNPTPHNGGDNAGYVTLGYSLLHQGSYTELWDPVEPPHTKYPPIFPLLLAGVMALGVKGWAGLKVVPFVSTRAAGLFTFLWARGRGGLVLAAAVALLVALSDGVLDYSRWILSDPTFLALTLGALWALERWGREDPSVDAGAPQAEGGGRKWLLLGLGLAILAYFTRSAGLPLVVAVLGWLAIRHRWRVLLFFLLAFSVPGGLWWLRGRLQGGNEYLSEFWLLDPYRPDLGRAGFGGLISRVWENLLAYSTDLIPGGIVGEVGWLLLPLGLGLVLLALLGWAQRLRKGPGVAELFFPLYAGLMLLWPGVWSGDRFALPLLPLMLWYAGSALFHLLQRLKPVFRSLALALAFLALALPALENWAGEVQRAGDCRALAREGGSWACYGVGVREYVFMAEWSRANLPSGAAMVTRKPRIFYLMSGVKTLSLPLTTDAGEFLKTAAEKDARYLTVDRWDGLAGYYLPRVVGARPHAFCYVTGVDSGGEMGIQLLGIMPEGGGGTADGLEGCPGGYTRAQPLSVDPVPPGKIPLLVWGS